MPVLATSALSVKGQGVFLKKQGQSFLGQIVLEGVLKGQSIDYVTDHIHQFLIYNGKTTYSRQEIRAFVQQTYQFLMGEKVYRSRWQGHLGQVGEQKLANLELGTTIGIDRFLFKAEGSLFDEQTSADTQIKLLQAGVQTVVNDDKAHLSAGLCLAHSQTHLPQGAHLLFKVGCLDAGIEMGTGGMVEVKEEVAAKKLPVSLLKDQASKKARMSIACTQLLKKFSFSQGCHLELSGEICFGAVGGKIAYGEDHFALFIGKGGVGGGVEAKKVCD